MTQLVNKNQPNSTGYISKSLLVLLIVGVTPLVSGVIYNWMHESNKASLEAQCLASCP